MSPLVIAQNMESQSNSYAAYPNGNNVWGMQYKYGKVMAVYFLTLTKIQLTGPYGVKVDSEEHRSALVQKLDTAIKMIKNGDYKGATNKIENDILKHGEEWILSKDYVDGTRYADHTFAFKSPLISATKAMQPEFANTVILDRNGNGITFVINCGNCVSAGPWCKYLR